MLFSLVLVAAGLATLFLGGEALVRGGVVLAQKLGVSTMAIGLLVVGFGTSLPELLVSVQAVFDGAPEIALGNVVGSNIANVLLIVGAATLFTPIVRWGRDAKQSAVVSVAAAALLCLLCLQGRLEPWAGWLLLALLAVYLVTSFAMAERGAGAAEPGSRDAIDAVFARHAALAGAAAILGIGFLVLGADLLIEGAVTIARAFGISDAVIGLSLVAIGTSLPELAAAVVASVKRQPEVVVGSVIGSNIFNILAILGVTLTLGPIEVAERISGIDAPLVAATSLGLLLLLLLVRRMGRRAGVAMLGMYCGYIVLLYAQGPA